MIGDPKTNAGLTGSIALFLSLAVMFMLGLPGGRVPRPTIPLVAVEFTNLATVRVSIAEQIRGGTDPSDFDCYVCHDRKAPPILKFDAKQNLVIPKEHEDIVMAHGSHNRNNNCYNCHNEANLDLLQTRDGRELKLTDSTPLCGSCHGPTYRDWEGGGHGRTSGFWNRSLGPLKRQDCVACHNPHAPAFPAQKPGPGPNPLRPVKQAAHLSRAGGPAAYERSER